MIVLARIASRLALAALWFTVASSAAEPPEATSRTVIGEPNPELAAGAEALRAKDYERGIALTRAGLERPHRPRDRVAALANLCAGHVGLQQYDLALVRCSQSLELDPDNWRALNNRAAAWLGKRRVDAALADLRRALAINPDAATLKRSWEIALEHQRRYGKSRDAVRIDT